MAASPLARGGFILSILVAVALAFTLQRQKPLSSSSKTYCYQNIRTQNDEQPSASCFSVADGVFTQVSSDTATADVRDGYVIPGLWDSHGHLLEYGEFLNSVDLFGSDSLENVRSCIKAYIAANPGAGTRDNWVGGFGWDQAAYGRMPTAADIEQDPALKGLYIMLARVDGHCYWVSQAVLDLLPSPIPDVPGGEVIRDPPGLGVLCDNALNMVYEVKPAPKPDEKSRDLRSAMRKLNELGLVGMHDAGVVPEALQLYAQQADSDDWTVRVYAMVECPERNTFCVDDVKKIARDDGRLYVRSVKLFADGALGSWGSAMIEPYSDHPSSSGSLLINGTALTSVAKSWANAGFQVNIHAIGDLANRNVINALEAALTQECASSDASSLKHCQQTTHRFRIEHSQIIHPDDQERMHALGLIPSIQPTHATSDMAYAESRLGAHRTKTEAYRMRSFLDIHPLLGSDFPVEPPNPFEGMYAAVTRKSPHTGLGRAGDKDGWHTEETLTMDQALWGFTGASAHGAFLEGKAGQIREGAFADWVVLDEPLEEMGVEKLRSLKVRETWVAGRRVYSRDEA